MENSGQLDSRALFYVAVAMLTWSSAYAAIAYGLGGFTPGEVAFARLFLGSICFVLWMRIRKLPLPPLAAWPPLLALGLIGLSVYHLCLNYAETRIASGTAAIIIALAPAATAATSALWLRERLSARAVVGLAIALAGVVLVVLTSGKTVSFQPKAALVLVSVLAAAIYFTLQKPFSARYGAEAVTTVTFRGAARTHCRARLVGTGADIPRISDLEHGAPSGKREQGVELHLFLDADRAFDQLGVAG